MICLKRTQDIDGKDDPFSVACWEESEEGLNDFVPSKYYVDREDCMAEFCVTEEEFDKICAINQSTSLPMMVKSS